MQDTDQSSTSQSEPVNPVSAPPPSPDAVPELSPQPIPTPAVQVEPLQTPPPVTGKKSNGKKIILIIVGILILCGIGGLAIAFVPQLMNQSQPTPQPTPIPTPKVVIPKTDEMSDIIGSVPITENTVAAAKTGGQYYIQYQDQYFEPRDTSAGTEELVAVNLEDPESYTWHGLVDIPGGEIFDFVQLPDTNPGFSFIVRQQGDDGERYVVYYFAFNELSQTAQFDVNPQQLAYRIPKFYSINSAGTLAALHMYDCWECERHYPQTNVINFITKEMQILGPTSYFAWGTDENFEYKDYIPNTDPATLPLKQGSFKFTTSTVATPRPSATASPRPSATPASQ